MYGLILALILFGFAAVAYQGVVHSVWDEAPEASPPAATTLVRP